MNFLQNSILKLQYSNTEEFTFKLLLIIEVQT